MQTLSNLLLQFVVAVMPSSIGNRAMSKKTHDIAIVQVTADLMHTNDYLRLRVGPGQSIANKMEAGANL